MPFIDLDGLRLRYQLDGDGDETIVLVNGLADDLDTWMLQVPDLVGAGYRVLSFDNRGVGQSDKPMGPYTTAMLADDAKHLVDALSIERFHMVGVSMGGMIAQQYALRHGDDLTGLVLGCTYAAPGPFCSRLFAYWQDLAPIVGLGAIMRDVLLWAFTPEFFTDKPDDAAEFEQALRFIDQPVPAYLAQLSAIQTHDTRAALTSVTTPTLVLAAEQDLIIPSALSRELHSLVPGAEWATARGGHAFMWEYPEEFNRAVLDFVRAR